MVPGKLYVYACSCSGPWGGFIWEKYIVSQNIARSKILPFWIKFVLFSSIFTLSDVGTLLILTCIWKPHWFQVQKVELNFLLPLKFSNTKKDQRSKSHCQEALLCSRFDFKKSNSVTLCIWLKYVLPIWNLWLYVLPKI